MSNINRNYDLLFAEKKALKVDELTRKMYQYHFEKKKMRAHMTCLRLRFIEKVKAFYLVEENIWRTIGLLTSTDGDASHKEIIEELRNL